MKKVATLSLLAAALLVVAVAVAPVHAGDAEKTESWTGEVVDLACYVTHGAKGPDHADCAKTCVKAGQPMGLLTADGDLVLLAADHKDGAPYEALKDLAGEKAKITGVASERDGMTLVTVKASEPAS